MKERNRRECSGVVEQRQHESNVLVMRGMAQPRNETRAGARESWGGASLSRTCLWHGQRETNGRNWRGWNRSDRSRGRRTVESRLWRSRFLREEAATQGRSRREPVAIALLASSGRRTRVMWSSKYGGAVSPKKRGGARCGHRAIAVQLVWRRWGSVMRSSRLRGRSGTTWSGVLRSSSHSGAAGLEKVGQRDAVV